MVCQVSFDASPRLRGKQAVLKYNPLAVVLSMAGTTLASVEHTYTHIQTYTHTHTYRHTHTKRYMHTY
jgi:hypothetical protein